VHFETIEDEHKVFSEQSTQYEERSTLSRTDLIELEGLVTRVMGRGTMEIQCDNNVTVRGVLSGRMKKNRIRVIQGDRVKVSVSPYDTSHGLVTYRFK
jgi:translation initiation factor IF-1